MVEIVDELAGLAFILDVSFIFHFEEEPILFESGDRSGVAQETNAFG